MARSKDEEIARGLAAAQLLENPLVAEVFDDIETLWIEAIRHSRPNQSEQREEAYRILLALDCLFEGLTHIVNTGKLAAQDTTADAQTESVDGEGEDAG